MNKKQKIVLILLIFLIDLLFLSIAQVYPISISLNTATFFQMPIFFWIAMIISPFLLFILSKLSKNKFVPITCAVAYYFIFFSYGLYYISHPTTTDIGSLTEGLEFLSSVTHIGPTEISSEYYLNWPVFFTFSKIFSTILGISPILTLNFGFMSLISIFPIFLIFFYHSMGTITKNDKYFIIPALYLTLAYFFINSQFAPQFLSLLFLIMLFGFYIKYRESKNRIFLFLVIIFYILTVFSHAFLYIFFLIAILFEKIWVVYIEKKKTFTISYEMIFLFFVIPFTYIPIYLEEFRRASFSESWRIFDYIFSQRTPVAGDYQINPLYYLVPEVYDQIVGLLSKGVVAGAFIIVAVGFFLYFLKKREVIDLGIIIGSIIWFVLGLTRMVLGQRALQVAPLSLSSHYKHPNKMFSYLSIVIVLFILIAPSLFIANTIINSSIEGERFVQDNEENIAGKFIDSHVSNESYYILTAQNPYPTGVYSGLRQMGLTKIVTNSTDIRYINSILYSPKLLLRSIYFNISQFLNRQNFIIYNSRNIDIISL